MKNIYDPFPNSVIAPQPTECHGETMVPRHHQPGPGLSRGRHVPNRPCVTSRPAQSLQQGSRGGRRMAGCICAEPLRCLVPFPRCRGSFFLFWLGTFGLTKVADRNSMESRGDGSWRLETGGLTRGSRECSPILSGSETRFCAPPNSRNQIKPSRPCLSFRLLTLFVEEAMAAVPSLAMQLPHDQHPKESGKCAALQRGFRPFPDITPTYSREPCDLDHPPIGNGPSSSLVPSIYITPPFSCPRSLVRRKHQGN